MKTTGYRIMTTPSESASLAGIRVAFFESRMAGPTADLIAKHGGIPLAAPALWEVPLGDSPEVIAFASQLAAGEFDVVIFETGVGVRYLTQAIEARVPREEWLEALARTRVVARAQAGDSVTRAASTGRPTRARTQHLARDTGGARRPASGRRPAGCAPGVRQADHRAGRGPRAPGATVTRVPVYRWALPEDLGPLRAAIVEIAQRRVAIALFTAAQQVEHLLQVAADEGHEAELRAAFEACTIIGSIGPTTSETLRAHNLPVDIEPEHPKLGHLIAAVAMGWRGTGKAAGVASVKLTSGDIHGRADENPAAPAG